jgi:hypothetical protein
MPAQPLASDAPEAATLAQVSLSLLKEAAVLLWLPGAPHARRCEEDVTRAAALLHSLLRVWPHKRHLLLPATDWPLLAAAMAPLLSFKEECSMEGCAGVRTYLGQDFRC